MGKTNLIVRGGADFSGLQKGLNSVQSQFAVFQSKISKSMSLVTKALGGIAVGKLIKDSLSAAIGVESSVGQISRQMGDSSDTFSQWAQTQAKSFGIARSEAYKYGAVYGNLISGFTKDTAATAKYTEQLIKASAIVASATGRTMEDTMERIRSGMLGNTEAIEDLGIYAQIGAIEATDAFKKLSNGKSWARLDYQTQQQIRLMSILEQATLKYGDSLAGTTTTRQNAFLATLKNIQLNIGNAFLPIYNAVLPPLTALGSAIESVTAKFASFMQAIFGTNNAQAQASTAAAKAQIATGKAVETAGKKAKGALGGFDEINALQQEIGEGAAVDSMAAVEAPVTGGVGGEVGISPEIEKTAAKFKSLIDSIVSPLKKINLTPITDGFIKLKDSITPFTSKLFEGLKLAYDNVLLPFTNFVVEEGAPAFLNALSGAFNFLNPLIETFKPLGIWLWETILQPIASWTGGIIVSVLSGIGDALGSIGEWISNNEAVVQGFTITVGAFFLAWKLTEFAAFIQMSGGIIAALSGITAATIGATAAKIADKLETMAIIALYAKDFVVNLAKSTAALITNAAQWIAQTAAMIANKVAMATSTVAQIAMTAATVAWNAICVVATAVTSAFGAAIAFLTSPIGLIILAIGAVIAIVVLLIKHWDEVKIAAGKCWEWIKGVWAVVAAWFDTNIIKPVGKFFSDMWNGIKTFASNAWTGVKNVWAAVSNWFDVKIISPVRTFFSGMFNAIGEFGKNAWNSIQTVFSGLATWFKTNVTDPIGNFFKGAVNLVIDALNWMIRGLNKISITMPDWVSDMLGITRGTSFGFNVGEIPRLANGGIVAANNPMLAMIGDNPTQKEAVAPLGDLYNMIVSAVGTGLMQVAEFNGRQSNQGDRPLELIMDGRVLGRGVLPYINDELVRLGLEPITRR